jgi:hypothetical protein
MADALAAAGVHADLCHDPLGTAVLCFRDPDNIALEFFEEIAPGTGHTSTPNERSASSG